MITINFPIVCKRNLNLTHTKFTLHFVHIKLRVHLSFAATGPTSRAATTTSRFFGSCSCCVARPGFISKYHCPGLPGSGNSFARRHSISSARDIFSQRNWASPHLLPTWRLTELFQQGFFLLAATASTWRISGSDRLIVVALGHVNTGLWWFSGKPSHGQNIDMCILLCIAVQHVTSLVMWLW